MNYPDAYTDAELLRHLDIALTYLETSWWGYLVDDNAVRQSWLYAMTAMPAYSNLRIL